MPSILDDSTVFVAGAIGLAGSAVVRRLLAASPTVRVRAGRRGAAGCFVDDPRVDYVPGDLRVAADCRRLLRGCDMAVLTAANTGGAAYAVASPWQQVTDNVLMDTQILQALHDEGVSRAIYVSSATVYQAHDDAITEDQLDWNQDPARGHFGVGWAKRAAEKLCRFWHDAAGLEVIVVRAANIYGPCARFDPARANVIPALIRKAVGRQDPFEAWGRPDVLRDVIYVEDFAVGVVALLTARDIAFDTFNLGSGQAVSVGEMVDTALRLAGHDPSGIVWRGDAPTTASRRVLDCGRIARAVGWRAEVSLEEGMRRTTAWWQAEGKNWTR